MKIIDDETLALYAEGKLDNDKEALDAVRKYLCSHPESLEQNSELICLPVFW